MEARWWVQKFLLADIQDIPVFVLYHSIVLIFNNFNWSIWSNNSKKVSFSVSGSVTKSGCSSVFLKVFFIDTPVETYSYSFGRENNFQFSVSIQQDFISFLNVQIDRQKKYKLFLFWMLVNIPCEEFYTSTLTWNKMLKLRICKISTWPKDFS